MRVAKADEVWPAPAKLNLFLHVIGRRADGYHAIQTAFQFLDFGDDIMLSPRQDGSVRLLTQLPNLSPDEDLTVRAASLLKAETGSSQGVEITVRKRIPMGGGLGGGSSDAATTLVVLNRLWELRLSENELAELAQRLGADVPVFVRRWAAWGEGVGERLEPVSLERPWYLVVTPPVRVSTARVFSDPTLTRNTPVQTIADLLGGGQCAVGRTIPIQVLLERGRNDCEPVTRRLYPEVDEVFRWVSRIGVARMTGTGGSVFTPFASQAVALANLESLPRGWHGFVARGLNRSPLD